MRIRAIVAGLFLLGSTAAAQVFAGHDMQLNGAGGGGAPQVTGGVLQLMNDQYGSATSAFTTATFAFSPATAWSTAFTLHYAFTSVASLSTGGDGIAFVVQGGAATALGNAGGDMGYGGIGNSLAVSFRSFWNDVVIGKDGNVDDQTVVGFPTGAGLTINPGDDFFVFVALAYDGANKVTVAYDVDVGAGRPATVGRESFVIDPSSLGPTVRLGFTSGSGGATQLAEVTEWTFTGLSDTTATPEPAPFGLVGISLVALGGFVKRRGRG